MKQHFLTADVEYLQLWHHGMMSIWDSYLNYFSGFIRIGVVMNKCSNRDNYYQWQGGNKVDGLVDKTALALAIFENLEKHTP